MIKGWADVMNGLRQACLWVASGLITFSTTASAAPESPERVLSGGVRAISALRLLQDRAPYLEYPASGAFGLVGSQGGPVEVTAEGGGSLRLARTSLAVGFGWRNLKLGLFWDSLKLGGDTDLLFGGFTSGSSLESNEFGVVRNIVPSLSFSLYSDLAITAAVLINDARLRTGFVADTTFSPLLRARLVFFDLELGFPKDPVSSSLELGTLSAGLGLIKLGATVGAIVSGSTDGFWSTLAEVAGEFRTFSTFYAANSNPFILDPSRDNVAETDIGLEWRGGPALPLTTAARVAWAATGDPGFRRAELELDLQIPIWQKRIAGSFTPHSYVKSMAFWNPFISFVDGVGSPGVTLLGLAGRAFLVRLDEEVRPGFSAGLRFETYTDHKRQRSKDDSVYLWYEGEDQGFVRSYLEFRASVNDTFSRAGLPYPDAFGVGLFYVVENLENPPSHDPEAGERAGRLERYLDDNADFGEATSSSDSLVESLMSSVTGASPERKTVPDKPDLWPDDADRDGLQDSVDFCPDLPEDNDGDADQDGCPDLDRQGF